MPREECGGDAGPAQIDQLRLSDGCAEGRHGRRDTCAGPEPSHFSASAAENKPKPGITGASDVKITLGTAASLPLLALQAPAAMTCLLAGLSSPAVCVTLATAESFRGPETPQSIAAAAAATAVSMASFARSMTWDPDPDGDAHDGLLDSLGDMAAAGADITAVEAASAAPYGTQMQSGLAPGCRRSSACEPEIPAGLTEVVRPSASQHPDAVLRLGSHLQLSPQRRRGNNPHTTTATVSLAALAALAEAAPGVATPLPAPPLSTKRGLYEGTVRGGNPRNTWRYLAP